MNDCSKSRYDMILGQYLLTELWLNLKLSEHVTQAAYGPVKGSTTPMVDLGMYIFKDLNTVKIKSEESFTNDYVKEVYESEYVHTTTKKLRIILDVNILKWHNIMNC